VWSAGAKIFSVWFCGKYGIEAMGRHPIGLMLTSCLDKNDS